MQVDMQIDNKTSYTLLPIRMPSKQSELHVKTPRSTAIRAIACHSNQIKDSMGFHVLHKINYEQKQQLNPKWFVNTVGVTVGNPIMEVEFPLII